MSSTADSADFVNGNREGEAPASPDALRAMTSARREGERTEKVMKWFMPAEKIALIKASDAKVTIGRGTETKEVVIRPLTPLLFAQAYSVLKATLVPIMSLYKPGQQAPDMPAILDALGDNIQELPKLIEVILRRGNNIEQAWIDQNFDLVLDLQLILPYFIEQNGLWKLFMGNVVAPSEVGAKVTDENEATPQTQD